MSDSTIQAIQPNPANQTQSIPKLTELSALELAQALSEKLTITDRDWHRLKNDRKSRAREQAAVALIFLLKDQPEEALLRLQQASGWLDRSISAPPCENHKPQRSSMNAET